jgi:cytochrome c biogenesis protein CcdA/thiol-disulfide isomerase/thioredoxin
MVLFLLAYLGGILTIASPCILPVLPFVFARADRPFVRSGLPLLIGMAATFALVGVLGALGGGWIVAANEYARYAALVLMALFGIALLFPAVSDRLTRPLVALGGRLSESVDQAANTGATVVPSLLLGVATGFLWAPCAGPILGLILTGAALQGANVQTAFLLLAYALGAVTALALALLFGGKVFAAMKRSLGAGEWIRRGLGALVLAAVVAIFFGLDTGLLTQLSTANTGAVEQKLLDAFHKQEPATAMSGSPSMMMKADPAMMMSNGAMNSGGAMAMKGAASGVKEALAVEGPMPPLTGAGEWLNSKPLTTESLKGKVVLVDFWTYSCINCLRAIPYVRAWAEKYKDQGLVVIGVHAPEFAFEKNVANVRKAVASLKIGYPVAIDNDLAVWRAFNNSYWPAHYFIDAKGEIRHHHFGEGDYEESERVIQKLLAEAGAAAGADLAVVTATGAEMPSAADQVGSPETYVGYARAENFVSPGGAVQNAAHVYSDGKPRLNEWGLTGDWTVEGEQATLNARDGGIVYRFHARDLHLVLGAPDGKPVRFRVTIDGKTPGASHGVDTDADGQGVVTGQQLYQLIRQQGPVDDRTFEIRFLDPGVQAFAFTFG